MAVPAPKNEKTKPPTRPGTLLAVHLLGVPVRLHFTFILLLVFLLFIGVGGQQSGLMTALYVVALFASVLLHELGHAMVARRYGIKTTEIVMYPIGGMARPERAPKAREELWIALAGPLVNALIAAALFGWLIATEGLQRVELLREPTDANLLERIALGNLALCLFNLLPAYPMDGGRILRSLLSLRRTEDEATRIAAAAGRALAAVMGLAGLLTANFMLVFVALFVYLGAAQEGAAVRGRILTSGVPVRAAAITDFHTLTHGQSLRDAGDLLLSTSQHDFPVVVGGQVVGLLSREALLRGILQSGPEAYVAGVMNRDFTRVAPDADLAEVASQLPLAGGCALVMDGESLVGLLTTENLTGFMLLRQAEQARAAAET